MWRVGREIEGEDLMRERGRELDGEDLRRRVRERRGTRSCSFSTAWSRARSRTGFTAERSTRVRAETWRWRRR